MRIFCLDSVHSVHIMDKQALQITENLLQDFLYSSYGIFTGKAEYTAILEFGKNRAIWVADEHWHSEQQSQLLDNGTPAQNTFS